MSKTLRKEHGSPNPDPREDPKSRPSNPGLLYSYEVDYGALRWIHFFDLYIYISLSLSLSLSLSPYIYIYICVELYGGSTFRIHPGVWKHEPLEASCLGKEFGYCPHPGNASRGGSGITITTLWDCFRVGAVLQL